MSTGERFSFSESCSGVDTDSTSNRIPDLRSARRQRSMSSESSSAIRSRRGRSMTDNDPRWCSGIIQTLLLAECCSGRFAVDQQPIHAQLTNNVLKIAEVNWLLNVTVYAVLVSIHQIAFFF